MCCSSVRFRPRFDITKSLEFLVYQCGEVLAQGPVLYISYDGLLEPLGQSQVLNYIRVLQSSYGYQFYLITYEKKQNWMNEKQRKILQKELSSLKIHWLPLRYHKRLSLLSTAFDISVGLLVGFYLRFFKKIKIVHARSYVPSVIGIGLSFLGCLYIFDMRGFWADEKVDAGHWSRKGPVYRIAKWFEQLFFKRADVIVSLTHAAVNEMQKRSEFQNVNSQDLFTVIPTCVDLNRFFLQKKKRATTVKDLKIGYVGSVQTWYDFPLAVRFFKYLLVQDPKACLYIYNKGQHDYILRILQDVGVAEESFMLSECEYQEVPSKLAELDFGLYFVRPLYSKMASAPTKMAEFLASGLPCVTGEKIGDADFVLKQHKVGVLLPSNSNELHFSNAYKEICELLSDNTTKDRCRAVAEKYFSLSDGAKEYAQIYSKLLQCKDL